MADLGAFFGNPNIQRQGARARALASQRDVNTLPDPLTYAVMQGLLGTRPDEMGFSVLNPDYEKIKKVAEPAFALGLLGQAAPALAPLTKGLPVGASIKNVGQQSLLDVAKRDASDIFGAGAQRIRYTDPKSGGAIDVLSRPDGTASVLGLEVPETFRGQGIGSLLQSKVLQDFPDMQGQVSSKAAATNAYKLGRRPPNMPNATIDDVYKMIDEDSSVNLISPQMQQRIAPTPETGLLGQDFAEYRGTHTAPNAKRYGATLDDLTQILPDDVYSQEGKRLYGIGDRLIDSEWRIAALKTRGKPESEIEIYRAVPKGVKEINDGDWVSTSKAYAKSHGEGTLNGEYDIITKKVKAKTLSTEGYPYEYGYNE
jgi:predicted GNAT family acetyltransferase